jgi:dephospho-CoA kinase
MIVIGLTGSVGMGKSTVARMFRRHGIPVYDADAAVHRHYLAGSEGYRRLAALFPEAVTKVAIDRKIIAQQAAQKPELFSVLERILHPLVRKEEAAFLKRARCQRKRAVVLDIPLLFETGAERRCDVVYTVSAPAFMQRRRVLARPGMTEVALRRILARQLPDAIKRRKADAVIHTGLGMAHTRRMVSRLVAQRLRFGCDRAPIAPNET